MQQWPLSPSNHPELNGCDRPQDVEEKADGEELQKEQGLVAPLEEAQEMMDHHDDEPGDLVYGAPEARIPKTLTDPQLPHPTEVAQHIVNGHNPYRSWCPVCIEAAGREDPHKSVKSKDEKPDEIPTMV